MKKTTEVQKQGLNFGGLIAHIIARLFQKSIPIFATNKTAESPMVFSSFCGYFPWPRREKILCNCTEECYNNSGQHTTADNAYPVLIYSPLPKPARYRSCSAPSTEPLSLRGAKRRGNLRRKVLRLLRIFSENVLLRRRLPRRPTGPPRNDIEQGQQGANDSVFDVTELHTHSTRKRRIFYETRYYRHRLYRQQHP